MFFFHNSEKLSVCIRSLKTKYWTRVPLKMFFAIDIHKPLFTNLIFEVMKMFILHSNTRRLQMLVFRWGQSWRLRRYVFYLETFHETFLISRLNFDVETAAQKILSDTMIVVEMRADGSKTKKESKESKNLMSIMEKPTASQLCKALYFLHKFVKTCLWPVFPFHTAWKRQNSEEKRSIKLVHKIGSTLGVIKCEYWPEMC